MGKGNPYKLNNGRFGSPDHHDYVLYEPNKDKQIEENKKAAKLAEFGDYHNSKESLVNPIPMASDIDRMQIEYLLNQPNAYTIVNEGDVVEVDIDSLKTTQPKLRNDALSYRRKHGTEQLPLVINLQGRTNVIVDGNHRVAVAKEKGLKKIKVILTKHTDYYFGKGGK